LLLSKILPTGVRQRWRPRWHRLRLVLDFRRAPSHVLSFDRELFSFVAVKPIGGKQTPLVVRSYRELRRWYNFGQPGSSDLVLRCLESAKKIDVFYDVGASNGIYGFAAHALHGCKVVFVEPYTPSVETILKTIYRTVRMGAPRDHFELVPAAIDASDTFARLEMHGPPIAGETRNTFADSAVYTGEDRSGFPVTISQWTKGVSLDALIYDYGLPMPTVIKVDVDGYERHAISGAQRMLRERGPELLIVEINDESARSEIDGKLTTCGYSLITHERHHPDTDLFVSDWVYARADVVTPWAEIFGSL